MAFFIKQNDTSPALKATLKDGLDAVVDLTGASVRFHMRPTGDTTAKVDAAAVIENADNGIVYYKLERRRHRYYWFLRGRI